MFFQIVINDKILNSDRVILEYCFFFYLEMLFNKMENYDQKVSVSYNLMI